MVNAIHKSSIYVKHSGPIIIGSPLRVPPDGPKTGILDIDSMDNFLKNLEPDDKKFAIDVIRTLLPNYDGDKQIIEELIIPIIQCGEYPENSKLEGLMEKFNIANRDDLDMLLFRTIQKAFMQIEVGSAKR